MNDQFPTWLQPILPGTHNAIGSQELAAGVTPSPLPDGRQIDLFGQVLAPASPSALPEKDTLSPTSATYGLSGSISSRSVALQRSLESKLRQQLAKTGSMIYALTWKAKVTPQGWSYYQLAASVPRTSGKDCSSWPTPATRDYKDTGDLSKSQFRKDGKERNDTIARVAQLVPWATPTVTDCKRGVLPPRAWDTGIPLTQQVGQIVDSSSAPTASSVKSRLNPLFSLWLMGYPAIEWASCAERVTRLSRKLPQSSSGQQ
jgi:hypothetical protein